MLGERDKLKGWPTNSVCPNGIVSIDWAIPKCLTWGSLKTLSIEFIGPHGTPTFSNLGILLKIVIKNLIWVNKNFKESYEFKIKNGISLIKKKKLDEQK